MLVYVYVILPHNVYISIDTPITIITATATIAYCSMIYDNCTIILRHFLSTEVYLLNLICYHFV